MNSATMSVCNEGTSVTEKLLLAITLLEARYQDWDTISIPHLLLDTIFGYWLIFSFRKMGVGLPSAMILA